MMNNKQVIEMLIEALGAIALITQEESTRKFANDTVTLSQTYMERVEGTREKHTGDNL